MGKKNNSSLKMLNCKCAQKNVILQNEKESHDIFAAVDAAGDTADQLHLFQQNARRQGATIGKMRGYVLLAYHMEPHRR